ncbi:MAG: PQ-loop repeat-containing protein [Gammaproteobacteria bacterium]
MSIHWFGYVGTALVIVAYLPQITHLIREKCSAGISFGAYAIWVVAAVLLLTYAILTRDSVFMALQSYQVLATGLICFYSKRFAHNLCEIHGGSAQVEPLPNKACAGP